MYRNFVPSVCSQALSPFPRLESIFVLIFTRNQSTTSVHHQAGREVTMQRKLCSVLIIAITPSLPCMFLSSSRYNFLQCWLVNKANPPFVSCGAACADRPGSELQDVSKSGEVMAGFSHSYRNARTCRFRLEVNRPYHFARKELLSVGDLRFS